MPTRYNPVISTQRSVRPHLSHRRLAGAPLQSWKHKPKGLLDFSVILTTFAQGRETRLELSKCKETEALLRLLRIRGPMARWTGRDGSSPSGRNAGGVWLLHVCPPHRRSVVITAKVERIHTEGRLSGGPRGHIVIFVVNNG